MDKHHLRILIVDDNPEDRETIRRYLKKDLQCEYIFLEAYTGEEALKLFRSKCYLKKSYCPIQRN